MHRLQVSQHQHCSGVHHANDPSSKRPFANMHRSRRRAAVARRSSHICAGLYKSLISNVAFASPTNGVPADWELEQVTALISANATWMLAQIYYSNPTFSIVNGQTQAGFVDEAFLRVAAVPEPATWALICLGAPGIAWRRRAGGGQRE